MSIAIVNDPDINLTGQNISEEENKQSSKKTVVTKTAKNVKAKTTNRTKSNQNKI